MVAGSCMSVFDVGGLVVGKFAEQAVTLYILEIVIADKSVNENICMRGIANHFPDIQ